MLVSSYPSLFWLSTCLSISPSWLFIRLLLLFSISHPLPASPFLLFSSLIPLTHPYFSSLFHSILHASAASLSLSLSGSAFACPQFMLIGPAVPLKVAMATTTGHLATVPISPSSPQAEIEGVCVCVCERERERERERESGNVNIPFM